MPRRSVTLLPDVEYARQHGCCTEHRACVVEHYKRCKSEDQHWCPRAHNAEEEDSRFYKYGLPLCFRPTPQLWLRLGNAWGDWWVGPFKDGKEVYDWMDSIELGPFGKVQYLGGIELPRGFLKAHEMCKTARQWRGTIEGLRKMFKKEFDCYY